MVLSFHANAMPMAPRANSANAENNRQQSETGPPHAPQSLPVQISQSARTKQKRQDSEVEADEPEAVPPSKQPRRTPLSEPELSEENLRRDPEAEACNQELPASKDQLSEENLRILDKMYASNPRRGSIKRTSSRRSIVAPSEGDSSRSQRSSSTTAHYRYKHLKKANLYIHVDPPDIIQAAIDDIVNAEHSEDRYAILREKAKAFCRRCQEIVRAAAGEDDFVHVFHTIAEDMSSDSLIFRQKADWREDLKPTIQKRDANLSFLLDFNAMSSDGQQGVDEASAPPPPKRHQQTADRLYISTEDSQTNLSDSALDNRPSQSDTPTAPTSRPDISTEDSQTNLSDSALDNRPSQSDTPTAPTSRPDISKNTSPIKTPRPDITVGITKSALISALASTLSSQNPNYTKAEQFLEDLQDTAMPSGRDGPQQPALIAVPTQRESDLTFPSLVFEGKGYSTGKQVFEAQNQVAVAGACGLKIQIMLDELVKRAISGSDVSLTPSENQIQLFFSICTEGPYHELWAHYTVIEDGERKFMMVLLDICNGVVLKQVERFLVEVDNIMIWTSGPFLSSVVQRLGKVARMAVA